MRSAAKKRTGTAAGWQMTRCAAAPTTTTIASVLLNTLMVSLSICTLSSSCQGAAGLAETVNSHALNAHANSQFVEHSHEGAWGTWREELIDLLPAASVSIASHVREKAMCAPCCQRVDQSRV